MAMIKKQQSAKRGQMILYIVLLAVVIACMVALSLCDRPKVAPTERPSGGDTLDIAIEYSPVTYYTYDDTLGGYNYDHERQHGTPDEISPRGDPREGADRA